MRFGQPVVDCTDGYQTEIKEANEVENNRAQEAAEEEGGEEAVTRAVHAIRSRRQVSS